MEADTDISGLWASLNPVHHATPDNAKEHMQNRRQEAGLILGHDKDSNGDRYANRSGARLRHKINDTRTK